MFAVQADGGEVVTVEGLARGEALSPLQRAFRAHHALQCGFCTPGFLVAATALLDENPDPTPDEVRAALSGHVCRCTGYVGIVEAVLAAAKESRG
jgi:carbon-monoxide dehydrogenase small subunit